MEPFFSVILTCYNYQDYVEQAIDSVFTQDNTNWELGIIDDASIDKSLDSIVSSLSKYPNYSEKIFCLQSNEVNRGCVYSRNYLISKATGKFILILDADDYFLPGFFGQLFSQISKYAGNNVFQYGEYILNMKTGKQFPAKMVRVSSIFDILPESWGFNYSFSREAFNFVGGYSSDFDKGWEDLDLNFRLIRNYGCVPSKLRGNVYRMYKLSREVKVRQDPKILYDLVRLVFSKHPEACKTGYLFSSEYPVCYPEDCETLDNFQSLRKVRKQRFRNRPFLRKYKRVN